MANLSQFSKIRAQSEEFAIGSARHSLSVITGLLADFGRTQPQIIIFPLFLLKGNTILPITPKADCDSCLLYRLICPHVAGG